MNVTQLQQPPLHSSSPRSASEAEDITPDFLSVRLVNKRTRIKLSPEPLDLTPIPNKGQLFVVASTLEWFVAIIRLNAGLALVSSPLADLRSQLSSLDGKSDNAFQPQRTIPFSTVTPNYLLFACNDTRLVVALTHGPVIVFEASAICSPGTDEVTPLHTFLPTTPTPTAVRQMYANPGDIPELVALLREPDGSPDSQLVEVINVSTMQSVAGWSSGRTPETFPTSISWSPKGKQLAIALQSGDIVTFSPSEIQQAKSFVTRPSSVQGQRIIHATWLSNPTFYAIFSSFGSLDPQADQKHMIIVHDPKRPDASTDISLPIDFFPSGVRPPGAFTIVLKGWDPVKILLLVGDSTTADIGLMCCAADDKWQKLSFDEGAPSMPLDVDQNETTMIGFELDLKNRTPYDVTTSTGETVSVPPPPVVWAYASDGTVIAWYVVNTRGTPYPGMGQPVAHSPVVAPAAPAVPTKSPFSQVTQPVFGQPSQPTFSGQPFSSTSPTFGKPGFGQTSTTTGSTFGQPPTFGKSAFGQPSALSTFGQASSDVGAFAAFASSPVKWGQASFGSTPTGFSSAASAPELSFGGMSLGEGTNDTQRKTGIGVAGIFGTSTPAAQPAPSPVITSTFGSGSFNLSPGVGAFAKFAPKADETLNTSLVEAPKPSPASGQTGFSVPTLSQSGFSQPAFGQSGFGKTGLGTPMSTTPVATPINTTSTSTFGNGGGFSAFASGGLATFSGSKPAETKLGAPVIGGSGGFNAFASGGPTTFSQVASNRPDTVPVWKTSVGITPCAVYYSRQVTFPPAEPAASTTPSVPPPGVTTSPEKTTSPLASTTSSTSPSTARIPSEKVQPPSAAVSYPTDKHDARGSSPPANAFMGLKMSTGFGLSNFNAKDSPFSNPKPVSQTVSAFGGQLSAPKVPVPATPGSVFGQTSVIGVGAKPVSAFGPPSFTSPSTPLASTSTTPSSSQAVSSNAFSAFSSSTTAFGKSPGSGMSFSDMLRNGGSSPESAKLKESPKTPGSALGSASTTPKSVSDKSPTPQPARVTAPQGSEDEEKGEKDTVNERHVVSAASSFSNLSSSTSSFVDLSRDEEEDEDEDEDEEPTASDGGDGERSEQQIDEFLSDTYSEEEADEEEDEAEAEGQEEEEEEEEEESDSTRGKTGKTKPPRLLRLIPQIFLYLGRAQLRAPRRLKGLQLITTPPGSPLNEPSQPLSLQTPLQQPTPTLPSPSLSPSPAPGISLGRPNTRPLRSSPLTNTPVSGGDEEEVKGEKPSSWKPRPASPKTPFGQWSGSSKSPSTSPAEVKPTPPPPNMEPLVSQSARATPPVITRPETPPSFPVTGLAVKNELPLLRPRPRQPLSATEDTTKPTRTAAGSPFTDLKPGPFPKPEPNAETPQALDPKPTPGPLFGPKPATVLGTTPKVPPTPAPGPPFGNLSETIPGGATPAVTATNAGNTPSRTSGTPSIGTLPKDAPSGEPMSPMQVEFTNLITGIRAQLANLAKLARDAREQRDQISRPTSSVSHVSIAKEIREFARDIEQLEIARSEDCVTIRELETSMLKTKTRKEEIARFEKARSDAEFEKMLRARFLSPEQTELQTQLRRDIRSIQDRVIKMEDCLQASKKKLSEFKTGKPSIKPPSLDTVNRTSRNINLAIRQQTTDVSALSARISKLDLDDGSPSGTPSRTREWDIVRVRRSLDVTPHVASTTAAALNAEQAAHRLKEALLAVRTEPLLNTQAVHAKPPPGAFDTPQKPSADVSASSSGGLFSTPFKLPPLNAAAGSSLGVSPPGRRNSNVQKHHAKSVPLKSTPAAGTVSKQKPAFDWGPLPGIKPMTTLSSDLRKMG
ncbi:hypothetical protein B0F90DRAFT_1918788 [Multifurca ochricompacta]|uniref:Nucleoporin Nup159/Nup146 N-terminal domain-containing protein n=1 Tax=Multifurca ochricompacta TaxID=376703 RepID=A0AAD4M2G0_9AGAM|nr:hypothetical protein B0F90DRAFT_1918788 [Multifurca ochricompacta]